MKTKYIAPSMLVVTIGTHRMIAESTTEVNVYTDDPQSTGNAMTRDSKGLWDDEW